MGRIIVEIGRIARFFIEKVNGELSVTHELTYFFVKPANGDLVILGEYRLNPPDSGYELIVDVLYEETTREITLIT